MQLFSSPKSQFPPLFPPPPSNPNPNPNTCRSLPRITVKSYPPFALIKTPPCSSKGSSPPPLQEQILCSESEEDDEEGEGEEEEVKEGGEKGSEGFLTVRRPVMEVPKVAAGSFVTVMEAPKEAIGSLVEFDGSGDAMDWPPSTSKIDLGLSELAKKIPIFEPGRVGVGPEEKPIGINLELGLYRAKVLARKFESKEAEKILCKCILFWPEDGRAYVALGKLLSKQLKISEARSVYERGCQATQGENPYIWQCWAVLENKVGNIRRARELFDAATVADKKHVAAWHGWAVLEIKQGNIKNARNLLGKALKYCGGNEYIYQTLALLEAKGNRFEHARYLFRQATLCNPKSCASWLAWAQVEMQQENNHVARKLFEKAVQASPKNRFAWHVWGIFEASQGDIAKGRKLLKIGHALNPRDPVLLQSLALLEYKQSSANLARTLFRRASELDPRHQPVWMAWGWMEWKEGNISIARELYQRALSIDSTSESAARCIQAWGVLEQRLGNLSAARRLFRSSLNVNSQSYVTWMTWASLEEEQGNAIRAEEIRNMYFQQRTEVVDDASWVMGFFDIIDPALDSIKRLLNLDQNPDLKGKDILRNMEEKNYSTSEASSERVEEVGDLMTEKQLTTEASVNGGSSSSTSRPINANSNGIEENTDVIASDFDVDAFVKDKLSLDTTKLDAALLEVREPRKINYRRRVWRSKRRTLLARP